MILEYKIDYRSDLQIFQKIFLKLIEQYSLNGKIIKDDFILKCYIQIENSEDFENFSKDFAKKLPNSIFLYQTEVNVIEEMPTGECKLLENSLEAPFCLDCLESITDKNSKNYYNIFTQCDLCGYHIDGEHKNYKDIFQTMASSIKDGYNFKINTFYGTYNIGQITQDSEKFDFDIVAYDYATISKYTNAKDYELKALASFEKPFIRLNTNLKFKIDISELKRELYRFKLADDFILHLLMNELHLVGVDMLFITKDDIEVKDFINLVDPKELEPIEVVASSSHIAFVKGDRSLPKFSNNSVKTIPSVGAIYSIIKEHDLDKKYTNMVGVYLSKTRQNTILLHGEKFGTVNFLLLEFELNSIKNIFDNIINTNDTGKKLIENYKNKFSTLYEYIVNIKFNKGRLNIYELWGVLSMILGFSDIDSIEENAKILEENTLLFLGDRGPRIDYKLIQKDKLTTIDPLMIVRSAISFKLAGIDTLTLSYGIVESFVEFISNEIDTLQENMGTEAVLFAGSLLQNNKLFAKLVQETSSNHKIYFNNQLLVDDTNLFYVDKL